MKEGFILLPEEEKLAKALAEEAKKHGLQLLSRSGTPRFEGALMLTAGRAAPDEAAVLEVEVRSAQDLERIASLASAGATRILVRTEDWKIIPLENLIADFGSRLKLYAMASSAREAEQLLHVLERGVAGVALEAEDPGEIAKFAEVLRQRRWLRLVEAKVTRTLELGPGDRVCVDTVGLLGRGTGLLVGSRASFLFLVHAETEGSAYVPPRPFRVNAGGVHSYVLMPDLATKYLCELQAGDRVLVVGVDGIARPISVGRAKIERRPLRLVEASSNGETGTIALQDAETICLVEPNGAPRPVTSLSEGERVLVHLPAQRARHLGKGIDEFIVEK
jgi:3-dehydroquinate synthase II